MDIPPKSAEELEAAEEDLKVFDEEEKSNEHIWVPKGEGVTVLDPMEQERRRIELQKAEMVATQVAFVNPIAFAQMKMVADAYVKDGAVSSDVKNASQMLMKLQAGAEMGMTPTESLSSLYLVNGRLTIFGQAVPRRLKLHGWDIQYKDGEDECTAIVYKGGKVKYSADFQFDGFEKQPKEMYVETLTMADAAASDGASGPGWKAGRNRKLKLRYGALAAILKTYLPHLLGPASDLTETANDFQEEKEGIKDRIKAAKGKRLAAPKFEAKPMEVKNAPQV